MHLPETTQLKTGTRFWNSFSFYLTFLQKMPWSLVLSSLFLAPSFGSHDSSQACPCAGDKHFPHSIMVQALGFVSGSVHLSPSSSTD